MTPVPAPVSDRVLVGSLLDEIAAEQQRLAEAHEAAVVDRAPVVLDAVELVRHASEVAGHAARYADTVDPRDRSNARLAMTRLAAATLQAMAVLDFGSGAPSLPAESGPPSAAEQADLETHGPGHPASVRHRDDRADVTVLWRPVAHVRLCGREVVRPGGWSTLEEAQATVDEARRRFRPEDLIDVWLERRQVVATHPCRVDLEAEAVVAGGDR